MSLQQRLTKLEQAAGPAKDTREPLLIEFIGYDPNEPDQTAGLLYIYNGPKASEYRLNPEQLADYKASNQPAEIWLNTVPRPPREAKEV
jgi:hypothetical protein